MRRWREPVHEMQRQSGRMRGIVQDLLELSKLEAQGGEAEQAPVDVGGMLAMIRRDVLSRPQHPATVNLELATDAMLLGAENELHSVFSNLVSNAVKYTPADGTIDIRWWVDEKGGHVSRSRHRHRHPGRAPAATHRALLSRGCRSFPAARRLGARPRDRETRIAAS